MNNYNNMFGNATSIGDASVRFSKRPRFGVGINNNTTPRYPHPKQTIYQQYAGNKNTTETYQSSPNQYDSDPRHFYGPSLPTRPLPPPNQSMQINKPPPSSYSHNNGSPSSSFSTTTPNTSKPPPPIQSVIAQAAPAARIAQNTQQQQTQQQQQPQQQQQQQQQPLQQVAQNYMDSSNYYAYGYNSFYPTYGTEVLPSATPSTYPIPDAISSYLWQTITSTPPPNLPLQAQQPQLPPPPLPLQKPPAPPPLPGEDKTQGSQSSSSSKTFAANTTSSTTNANPNHSKANDLNNASRTIVKMKPKRKNMSARYKLSKSWSEEDAALALKAEEANARKLQKDIILILRFPDPEISREIVKCYSPDIESVHFQLNFAPRYCLVHLKPGANVEKTVETLSKIPFGTGFLSVEIKQIPSRIHTTKLNEIDPYTLYVGNLPTTIACKTLKDYFPGAARIDIGFAQRMKYTRYAFIRYQTVHQAIEAYKRTLDTEIDGRSLTIRFRRLIAASDGNREDVENIDEVQDENLGQSEVPSSEDTSATLNSITESSETSEHENPVDNLAQDKEHYTDQPANDICQQSNDSNENNEDNVEDNVADNVANNVADNVKDHVAENVEDHVEDHVENSLPNVAPSVSTTASNANNALVNIKPDPDIDPADRVVGNEGITTRFDSFQDNVKLEKELSTDFEFFAPAASNTNNANAANKDKRAAQDTVSINSITDDTDTMSTMSASSLGEFLQSCQTPRVESNDIDDIIAPPQKKNKRHNKDDLIKTEPLEQLQNNSQALSSNTIKREVAEHIDNSSVNNKDNNHSVPQNRNNKQEIHNKDRSVARRKNRTGALTHNDDLVPSNALFSREDNQNSFAPGYDIDGDDDEFFDTRTKSNAETQSQIIENIKTEPLYKRRNRKQNDIKTTNSHQTKSYGQNLAAGNSTPLRSTTSLTALPMEEDDLVPEQNMLSSRLNAQTVFLANTDRQSLDIKQEAENEDIFSAPTQTNFRNDTASNTNEDSNLSDLWNTNLLTQSVTSDAGNKTQKTTEGFRSCPPMAKNEDNDIVLVSDNISRRNVNPQLTPVKSEVFSYNRSDLLRFTPKTTAAMTTLESPKLLPHHHDNLDKLFATLDSDSDNEL